MCLNDGHFLLIHNDTETPLDDIAAILPGAGKVRLVDLFGKQREVAGCIQEIDLLNKRIVVG
jgi:predicted RNA-binding protein